MKRKLFGFLMACLLWSSGNAQLTSLEKNEMIDSTIRILNDNYIFPEVAQKIEKYLRVRQQQHVYENILDGNTFAQSLSNDLKLISKDKHLNVVYSEETIPYEPERDLMTIPEKEKQGYARMLKHVNYGIRKIDVLKGNIGYIDVDFFCAPEFAGDTYTGMMNYLAHTDALIIDLRNCSGSRSPDAVPFICSYFFQNPVHLNDIYFRKGDSCKQSWTYSYVPGQKYLNKPIYILTSGSTFSGAEELAYDLKNLKRATIIGRQTGGGANPGGFMRATEHFSLFVPIGRAFNPITKSNWEEVGVAPDTVINTKLALYKAQELALERGISTSDEEPWKNALTDWLSELQHNKPVLKFVSFALKGYDTAKDVYVTGSFNDWDPREVKMQRQGNKWTANTLAEPGKISYKFIVDGDYITDPANPDTESDRNYINSVKTVE